MTSELKKDQDEVKRLLQLATRVNVKSLLQSHLDSLEKSIQEAKEQEPENNPPTEATNSSAPTSTTQQPKCPLKKITSYAWDQSDLYVKVYATSLPGVQKLPAENITCDFNTKGFTLMVNGLDGKNHQLQISSLYATVVPEDSKFKIKTDSVLVMLKKGKKEKWEGMTEMDRKKKEKQKMESAAPKADEDPQAGIMNLMKKMYDEGDDDMKRTIAKAWTESQDKKAAGGGLGDF